MGRHISVGPQARLIHAATAGILGLYHPFEEEKLK